MIDELKCFIESCREVGQEMFDADMKAVDHLLRYTEDDPRGMLTTLRYHVKKEYDEDEAAYDRILKILNRDGTRELVKAHDEVVKQVIIKWIKVWQEDTQWSGPEMRTAMIDDGELSMRFDMARLNPILKQLVDEGLLFLIRPARGKRPAFYGRKPAPEQATENGPAEPEADEETETAAEPDAGAESANGKRCSRCGQAGHNVRTCPARTLETVADQGGG